MLFDTIEYFLEYPLSLKKKKETDQSSEISTTSLVKLLSSCAWVLNKNTPKTDPGNASSMAE